MKYFVILAALTLSGCTAMEKNFVQNSCNYDGGFEWGTNDANEGKSMNSRRFGVCPTNKLADAKKGYREGYSKAKDSDVGSVIAKGIGGLFGAATSSIGHRKSCSGSVFGRTYAGTGVNEGAAKNAALDKCKAGKDSFHCGNLMLNCKSI